MSDEQRLKILRDEIVSATTGRLNDLKSQVGRLTNDVGEMKSKLGAVVLQADELSEQVTTGTLDGSPRSVQTPGDRFIRDNLTADQLRNLTRAAGRIGININDGLFRPLKQVTVIDSSSVGSSTAGILTPQRVVPYVTGSRRRLTLRDLLPVRTTDASAVEFPKENAFTNAASPQTEGSAKAESALTFTITSVPVRTLAHWIPASSQVLDDWGELARVINEVLLYGLKLVEENQILTGNGTGQHLSGLITEAAAYAGTYDVGSDTKLDKLRHALLELEEADETPTFFALNPRDVHDVDLIKTEDGGVNKGSYVVGDPLGGAMEIRTLWGLPVVSTNTMTQGEFLVGDAMQATIFDRMQANVQISTEHSDYFTRNLVAIRAE